MKTFNLINIFLLALFFSSTSSANEILKVCNGCSSSSSFYWTAKATVQPGMTKVKVLNSQTGKLKSYKVTLEPFEPGYENRGGLTLEEVGLTFNEYQNAQKAFNALQEIHNFFNADRELPSSILNSGYEIIGTSSNFSKVVKYYNSNQTLGSQWSAYTGALAAIAGKVANVNITVSIKFNDGMIATLKINGFDNKGNILFKLIDMKDKKGNDIPVNKKEAEEQKENLMNFSTVNEVSIFLDAVGRFGVTSVRTMSRLRVGGGSVTIHDNIVCDENNKCVKVN